MQVVNTVDGTFQGPDTDLLGGEYRSDGIHFNEIGLTTHAAGWRDAIVGHLFMCDFDLSGRVDLLDFATLGHFWSKQCPDPAFCQGADLNADGTVDLIDLAKFVEKYLGK